MKTSQLRKFAILTAIMLLAGFRVANAIGPHELLVLANTREPESVAIAEAYIRLRQIPAVNLIKIDLGDAVKGNDASMPATVFTEHIWAPVVTAMRERGIDDHILAWVYSTHFPFRISTSPPVSLQGLTFVRNQLPPPTEISKGTYASPLFAGPDSPTGNGFAPQTFDSARLLLREEMPLPNITLGYTGKPNGNTAPEILAMLRNGKDSDSSAPKGTVYYITRDDIRSKAREWQFNSAASGLRRMGVDAVITNRMPENAENILGIMTGSAIVNTTTVGRFLPGAMAEHLTSFAGALDNTQQTKITRWIAAGATGTAGTVCEPMSYWTKFPNARFFNHYRMGCTLIESFYQSIRSPLQLMLIGDPLAAPWAPEASLRITGIEENELLDEPQSIDLHIQAPRGTHYSRFVYLVDGRIAGEGSTFTLDPEKLKSGTHELRAIAYQIGFVRSQVFDTIEFRTP